MFESTEHRARFLDLVSCYYNAPFFSKGLCKCMYLSSWDDEHFIVMLGILNELVIDNVHNTNNMADQGHTLALDSQGYEAEIYKLSTAFLTGQPYEVPDLASMDPDGAYIIRQAILAGKYIDDLPDPRYNESIS